MAASLEAACHTEHYNFLGRGKRNVTNCALPVKRFLLEVAYMISHFASKQVALSSIIYKG